MKKTGELRWMLLDNAAKIYPASRKKNWISVFRVSVSLTEEVDREILLQALKVTIHRFPSIAAKLRRGMFWYYLEELENPPAILEEGPYPFVGISYSEMKKCCFRVIVHHKRIALEFFHVVTDGNGGLTFLKSLTAYYIYLKYGVKIPPGTDILDAAEPVKDEELEDSFVRFKGKVTNKVKGDRAFHVTGTKEEDDYLNVICGTLPVDRVLEEARKYKVSMTVFLSAVMIESLMEIQEKKQPIQALRKTVNVLIPVNLRNYFDSKTLRNFVLFVIPGVNPSWGKYTFDEIISQVYHQMGGEITGKHFNTRFAGNVKAEETPAIKVIPLFIKNMVLRYLSRKSGDRNSSISLSNLGNVALPKEMEPYVERFDFILGKRAESYNNCGVISYGGKLRINFIRTIKEPVLEQLFFTKLRKMGIPIHIESNSRGE
ncbi:MAG: hypothetical protein IJ291_04470 [Lachnospiraceae bacterium]|nr:hypothetical protein [Lachnospiraceae bacterium]